MTKMTEEWVMLWNQALSANFDYSIYCQAKEDGNLDRQKELETKFPSIAGIYDDFGSVDGADERFIASPHWKKWFERRRHLFILEPSIGANQSRHLHAESVMILTIPLKHTAKETTEDVTRLIDRHYGATQVIPHPKPKYQLHSRRGTVACGFERVRQACLTSAVSYTYNEQTGETERDIRTIIQKFLLGQIDNLGWSMEQEDRVELQTTGSLDQDVYDGLRPRIDKLRRDLKFFSQNALLGRFPDDSEPEINSKVMDQFWGE